MQNAHRTPSEMPEIDAGSLAWFRRHASDKKPNKALKRRKNKPSETISALQDGEFHIGQSENASDRKKGL